ncbi:hypothetical protein AC249_AIPGENE16572 [Exaiptasia diaphana]|nr:hypothetical protein AC249_AIPGENE16572 [Exaiptasia diaphana]
MNIVSTNEYGTEHEGLRPKSVTHYLSGCSHQGLICQISNICTSILIKSKLDDQRSFTWASCGITINKRSSQSQ